MNTVIRGVEMLTDSHKSEFDMITRALTLYDVDDTRADQLKTFMFELLQAKSSNNVSKDLWSSKEPVIHYRFEDRSLLCPSTLHRKRGHRPHLVTSHQPCAHHECEKNVYVTRSHISGYGLFA